MAARVQRLKVQRRLDEEKAVDRVIGQRIRDLRITRGLSQIAFGSVIGVTFQQVQKYERATNRVGPGKLAMLSEHFGVPISYFFSDGADCMEDDVASLASGQCSGSVSGGFTAREVRMIHMMRRAPSGIADQIRLLLKVVCPHGAEPEMNSAAERVAAPDREEVSNVDEKPRLAEAPPIAALPVKGLRPSPSRGAPPRHGDSESAVHRRRAAPRGAVWHPSDIR